MRPFTSRLNRILFFAIYAATFGFALFKALTLPITHDEVATTVFYSHFSNWEIMMYPDQWPNNHILNTLLAKGCIGLFGPEQWAVRLPNLLFFFAYAFGVYRLLRFILTENSYFFIPFALLFVANPYMMDFFALCRGYGMSIALSTLSASYLITGFHQLRTKHIWLAFGLAILASYANFTLLVFWGAVTLLTGFYFILRYLAEKKTVWIPYLIMLVVCAGYLALIYVPIQKMQSTNQFIYWTSQGFFSDTIMPLIHLSGQESGMLRPLKIVAYSGLALIALSWIYSLYHFWKNKFKLLSLKEPFVIGSVLILLTALTNILQSLLLGTPNLFGRTALFFFPLYMIALLCTYPFVRLVIKHKGLKLAAAVFMTLIAGLHVIRASNTKIFREWFYDGYTFKVLEIIQKEHRSEPVSLETNWLFNPSFQFYRDTEKLPWIDLRPYNKDIRPETDAEYYYVRLEDLPLLEEKFEVVESWDDNYLLRRKAE